MASRAVALLVILLFYYDVCVGDGDKGDNGVEYSSAALSTHIDTLLAEYDREVPPSPRTIVTLSLDVRHAAVDDRSSTMRLLADLKMKWTDPRLVWNASVWQGDSVVVSGSRLWRPDVRLSSAGSARDAADAVRARLSAAGAVSSVMRLDLAAPLALQLADWPRDRQEGRFTFASRDHTEDELQLLVDDAKGLVVVECGAWQVHSVSGAVEEGPEGGAEAATWRVQLARRGAALAAQQGAVLAAVVLLLVAAALRPYSQRLPLAACATLVSAFWLISVVFVVPSGGTSPRVVRVMCAACVAGACGGAGAALAHALARRTAPPPRALRALLSKLSAVHSITPGPECAGAGASGAWAACARLLDALLAALLVLALLVLIAVYVLA